MSSPSKESEQPVSTDYASVHGLTQLQKLLDTAKGELAVFSEIAEVQVVSGTLAENKGAPPPAFAPRLVFVTSVYLYIFDKLSYSFFIYGKHLII